MNYCYNCGARLSGELPATCAKCNTQFWKNPRCCAGALIVKDNSILLVRRVISPWAGHWDIPGGFCNDKELPADCAVREVYEESNLRIHIDKFYGIWLDPTDNPAYGDTICIYYLASPTCETIAQPNGEETDLARWFPFNKLPDKIAFEHHIPEVLKAWQDDCKRNMMRQL